MMKAWQGKEVLDTFKKKERRMPEIFNMQIVASLSSEDGSVHSAQK